MSNLFQVLISIVFILSTVGCSGIAVMQPTKLIEKPNEQTALVNFVRPYILVGDGVPFEVWDGGNFIGTLKAGTMVQYSAPPGRHCFMVDPGRGEKWFSRTINIQKQRTYYLKPNTVFYFGGYNLGLANDSDPRIAEWNSELTPMSIDKNQTKSIPQDKINEANSNLAQCDS